MRQMRSSLSAVLIFSMAWSVSVLTQPTWAQDKKDEEPKTETPKPADNPKPDKAEQAEDAPLPKKAEMLRNLPTKADLLTKPPADWIILKNEDVLTVKPISPRPRTLEFYAAKRKEFSQPPKLTRNTGESNQDFFARQRKGAEDNKKQHEKFEYIEIELPDTTKVSEDQDDTSYRLKIENNISEIIHHEDLMLRRVDLLLEVSELEDAYELLQILDRQNRGWPGFDERLNRFVLIDAQGKLARKEPEQAFVLLEQMHVQIRAAINSKDTSVRYASMGADLAKCSAELGKVADVLIEPAAKARDFRQVRFHLARLLKLEPEHPAGAKWKERLIAETNRTLAEAAQAAAANQHDKAAVLADQAALIWPATPALKNGHRQFAQRWQTLKVGVVDVPSTNNYPFPTEADRRREKLTRLPLFEPVRIDGGARYRSRFLDNWEPTDLGRQAVFTLRSTRSPWESSPILTASGAVSALLERLQPSSKHYDERLASFIDGIEVRGPFEFSVKFSRIPVRTEALFAMPLGTDDVTSAELDQRVRVHSKTDQVTVLRRSFPESEKSLQRHVAEVAEIKYASHEKAVQGLLRGEVSMLPNVPVWQLDQLAKDTRFFVRKYALPQTHFVQFNPKSKPLRSSELRRAMMFAVDRGQILRETILKDLTVRTLRETLPKANAPAKIPPESGLTYDESKLELVWSGLSMNDTQLRQFTDLSPDQDYRKVLQSLYKKSQPDRGRVVSAPFGTNLMSYNPVVVPRASDPSLAYALAMAGKKTLGGKLPKLRMICEAEPACEAAAKRLIEEWRKVDIRVELVPYAPPAQTARVKPEDRLSMASGPDTVAAPVAGAANANVAPANPAPANAGPDFAADGEPWDIVYRTGRIPEPMMELWPLLSLDTVARLQSVRYLPDWLRQGLIDLDRTADWSTTVSTVQELHRQLADTVQLLPLWELDDAIVFRNTLRGIPTAPLHTYQDFELWISEPWYPTDSQ